MKLLLVDTDCALVEMLTNWLKTQGYEVSVAVTGERACLEWHQRKPDVVLIDPQFLDRDGLALCRDMRSQHDALVLVLTDSNNVQDEIRCLEQGADDYLRKPFFPSQLLARLHALNRRGRATLTQRPPLIITIGTFRVDAFHNEVTVANKTIHLTPTESKLLHVLALHANTVCTTSQMVAHLWGDGDAGDASLLKAHMHHLRQKIERDPSHPTALLTIPGVGYTLTLHQEEEDLSSHKTA